MEKEMQEELVLDLPELLAMYLRKGVLILVCSCIFGILFAGLRTMRKSEGNPGKNTEEESAFDKDQALEEGTLCKSAAGAGKGFSSLGSKETGGFGSLSIEAGFRL